MKPLECLAVGSMNKISVQRTFNEETVTFGCGDDYLVGVIHSPNENNSKTININNGVVFVVGGPQYRVGSHRLFFQMARELAEEGVTVLRFDFRGMGDSSGEPRKYYDLNDDIHAAVNQLVEYAPHLNEISLLGLCDGATASIIYSQEDIRINQMILLNPWVNSEACQAQAFFGQYYLSRIVDKEFWLKIFSGKFQFRKSLLSFYDLFTKAFVNKVNQDKPIPSTEGADKEGGTSSALPVLEPTSDEIFSSLMDFSGNISIILSGKDLTAYKFKLASNGAAKYQKSVRKKLIEVVELPHADHTFSVKEEKSQVLAHCKRIVLGSI